MTKQIIYACDWRGCEEPATDRLLHQRLENHPPTSRDFYYPDPEVLRDYCAEHAKATTANFLGSYLERHEVPA